jgi:hypothetical protein
MQKHIEREGMRIGNLNWITTHSLGQTLALHLAPGAAFGIVYMFIAPMVNQLGGLR